MIYWLQSCLKTPACIKLSIKRTEEHITGAQQSNNHEVQVCTSCSWNRISHNWRSFCTEMQELNIGRFIVSRNSFQSRAHFPPEYLDTSKRCGNDCHAWVCTVSTSRIGLLHDQIIRFFSFQIYSTFSTVRGFLMTRAAALMSRHLSVTTCIHTLQAQAQILVQWWSSSGSDLPLSIFSM